jgi:hypothetical protein
MKRRQPLGLDELMIVNPVSAGDGAIFLGDDGVVYQLQEVRQGDALLGLGEVFLGADGTPYQVYG